MLDLGSCIVLPKVLVGQAVEFTYRLIFFRLFAGQGNFFKAPNGSLEMYKKETIDFIVLSFKIDFLALDDALLGELAECGIVGFVEGIDVAGVVLPRFLEIA